MTKNCITLRILAYIKLVNQGRSQDFPFGVGEGGRSGFFREMFTSSRQTGTY